MKYRVQVTETINHTYLIEADSREDARAIYQNYDRVELSDLDQDGQSVWDSHPWEIEEDNETPAPLQIANASSAVASPELEAALVDTRALASNPCNGGEPCGFGVYCTDQSGEWIETGFSDEAAAERFADAWTNYRADNYARVGLVISNDRAEWEEDTQPETIGARCVIEWHKYEYTDERTLVATRETMERYFSLGEYDEPRNCDTFGVPDEQVFYYTDRVEFQELTETDRWHHDGWRIVSYEWVTQ
jgi:hypothetical protein